MLIHSKGKYQELLESLTSKFRTAFGLPERKQLPIEIIEIDLFLGLKEFPISKTDTSTHEQQSAVDHRERMFCMLKQVFEDCDVIDAEECHEMVAKDKFTRPVQKVEFLGFAVKDLKVDVFGLEIKSLLEGGKRTIWRFEISPLKKDDTCFRERSVPIRKKLVSFLEKVNEEIELLERANYQNYMLTDGN